jgi:CheY-like chemotaxis protein
LLYTCTLSHIHLALYIKSNNTVFKILVAEDNSLNLELLSTILLANNFDVVPASDGNQAISVAHSQQPDLVLRDIQMPELDGH